MQSQHISQIMLKAQIMLYIKRQNIYIYTKFIVRLQNEQSVV